MVDTSSLISLAWAGLLPLLARAPLPLVLLDVVEREAVAAGLAAAHPDAAAIEAAVRDLEREEAPGDSTVDGAVVAVGARHGGVLANDQALGRRAGSLGARWLRTPDFLVLLRRAERLTQEEALSALVALHAAGRITDTLRDEYMVELR